MSTPRRLAKFVPALALVALAVVPSSASAQATRTWVSGVGDDANPCSRTAPCKTFAGAISKTANGGEINCLDPGGFGGVTIGKSLTIKCHYTEGGVLVSGTNAIVINATATDKVTLRGLDINGIGVGAQTSLSGIKVLQARQVNIIDNEIYRFQSGITIAPVGAQTATVIKGNHIHDNGIGVINAPGGAGVSFTSATVRYNDIQDNTCGTVVTSFGTNGSTPSAATNCGTAAGPGFGKTATLDLLHNGINLNGFGVFSRGGSASANMAFNEITGNNNFGLRRIDGGLLKTFSPATNVINNNAQDDTVTSTTPLVKRKGGKAKRVKRFAR